MYLLFFPVAVAQAWDISGQALKCLATVKLTPV